ncbi:MAG: hypothetical protein NC541_06100 [bacterium]|nr:hypothetical protein [bacterium]MCM1499437.1 hypothetical protein [Clostridium sp.]
MNRVKEKLVDVFTRTEKVFDKRLAPISLLFLSVVFYFLNPFSDQSIDSWDGVVGRALISGISVQHRIKNFSILIILIPCCFLLIWLLCSWVMKAQDAVVAFSGKYAILLAAPVANAYVNRYRGSTDIVADNILILSTLFFCVILLGITVLDREKRLEEQEYTFYYLFYLNLIMSVRLLYKAGNSWKVAGAMAVTVLLILVTGLLADRKGKIQIGFWNAVLSCFQWLPFCVCCILELLYVLNARGIYFKNYRRIICAAMFAVVLLQMLWIVYSNRKQQAGNGGGIHLWDINRKWGSLLSLGAILGYSGYYVMSAYGDNYSALFEIGNGSASIDTFLRGKLPVLDYFSGHAVSDVFSRIPFMYANGESAASTASIIFLGDITFCILFYLLARKLFDEDTALILLFTYPLIISGFIWSHLSLIAVIATLYLIERHTKKSYFIWWAALAAGVAMQYDRGLALGIGCIAAVFLLSLVKKSKISFKMLCASGAAVASVILIFCSLWWLHEGISPIFRIREWLALSVKSTSTWALETGMLGSSATFAFWYTYFLIPSLAVLLVLYSVIKLRSYAKNTQAGMQGAKLQDIALLITFSVSVLLFMSRELTYHTLYNGSGVTGVILNFVPWMVMCAVSVVCKEKKVDQTVRYAVMVAALGLVLFNHTSNVTKETPQASASLLNAAYAKAEKVTVSGDMSSIWGTERVIYSTATQDLINPLREIFDVLLKEDETFCDFANATGLYAYLNRERPFYAAQSPSILAGEFSQECFLEELSWYNVPLALLGNGPGYMENMNNIALNVRYWKVAEYIYENYRPLIQIGDFAVWCQNGRQDEFRDELLTHPELEGRFDFIDYGYDAGSIVADEEGNKSFQVNEYGYHNYDINLLPYITARYGEYDLIDSGIYVRAETDRVYRIERDKALDKDTGYYLHFTVTRTENTNRNSAVLLSDSSHENILFRYNFFITPEELVSDNLIRISEDYFWSAFDIDRIQFLVSDDVEISNVEVLALPNK